MEKLEIFEWAAKLKDSQLSDAAVLLAMADTRVEVSGKRASGDVFLKEARASIQNARERSWLPEDAPSLQL